MEPIMLVEDDSSGDNSRAKRSTFSTCDICFIKCLNETLLQKHYLIHTNEVLNDSIKDKKVLTNENVDGKIHMCKICSKCFISRETLRLHLKSHGDSAFLCEQCPSFYTNEIDLERHIINRHSEPAFTCEKCYRTFRYQAPYERHLSTHNKEYSFVCDICNRSYLNRKTLIAHRKRHTNKKRFVCAVCDKAFSVQSYLQKHSLRHTSETSYPCKTCGKSFFIKRHLLSHEQVHLKLHVCNVCKKRFSTDFQLKEHYQLRHPLYFPNQQFPCKFCHRIFAYEKTLASHYQIREKRGTCFEAPTKKRKNLRLSEMNNSKQLNSVVESCDSTKDGTSDIHEDSTFVNNEEGLCEQNTQECRKGDDLSDQKSLENRVEDHLSEQNFQESRKENDLPNKDVQEIRNLDLSEQKDIQQNRKEDDLPKQNSQEIRNIDDLSESNIEVNKKDEYLSKLNIQSKRKQDNLPKQNVQVNRKEIHLYKQNFQIVRNEVNPNCYNKIASSSRGKPRSSSRVRSRSSFLRNSIGTNMQIESTKSLPEDSEFPNIRIQSVMSLRSENHQGANSKGLFAPPVKTQKIIAPELTDMILKQLTGIKQDNKVKSGTPFKTLTEEQKCVFVVKNSLDVKSFNTNNKKFKVLFCEKSYVPNKPYKSHPTKTSSTKKT